MPTVERTFTVAATPSAVIEYLKDFSHATEWDPGTERCVQTSAGAVDVGTVWHNTSKIAGIETELDYTLERLTPDTIVFVGRNKTATSTDTITVTAADGGRSQITYRAELDFHGAAKLAAPAAKLLFEKLAHDTERQLTEVLSRLA